MINIFEKSLARSGYFGTDPVDAIRKNLTVGELFDLSADSVTDRILVPPFSWVMKNPEITNRDLRDLKKTSPDSVGEWLKKYGYDNNLLTRFFASSKKLRISRQMTVPEVTLMVSGIFKWLFLIMIPVNAFILFFLFYRKQLLYYDTLLFSVHFTSFFLVIYAVFLLEVLWLLKVNGTLLGVLAAINLLVLVLYLASSLKRVFAFSWISTILRMLVVCLIAFTVYQLVHYSISLHSGR